MSNHTFKRRGAASDFYQQEPRGMLRDLKLGKTVTREEQKEKIKAELEKYAAKFKVGEIVTTLFGQAELLSVDGLSAKVKVVRTGKTVTVAVASISKPGVKYSGD